ncbi:putative tail protein [Salmonella phage seszw]|nr:putative tail protein [Salmonella phage seszw]QZB85827.1 putative tail protein [Salmonella phage seszw]QZB85907.1 putative tail protein [Salmonella phage seszw]QZB85986.1 putative tail protein [Salmonella phage seszw]QZB86065.1 putative tail protein [Salmonella phage seszw]
MQNMSNRTPLTEIGEMRISLSDRSFFFKPSFRAMNEIGTPKEIVEVYAKLNGIDYVAPLQHVEYLPFGAQMQIMKTISKPVYGRHVLSAAYIVMQSCCEDDISVLIGGWKPTPRGVRYVPGIMPVSDIIIIARNLMQHGIIGKSPLKVPERLEEQGKKTTNEFHASQYIISARTHFDMTRDEAENLSMTEFQMMIKNKYPEPKGLTKEERAAEYDQAKADRERMKALAERKAKKARNT